jgi:uncharacterized protein (TIGR02594 family)
MTPYDFAATMIGRGEVPDNAALRDYLTTGGANLDPATTAWCAAFVNSSLGQAGLKGTGSNMARSFLEWGQPVDQPQKGDIAVFSRGDPNGPFGHVGFFDSFNPDGSIKVLGGNQSDAVSLATYGKNRLLGFRRAADGSVQPVSSGTAGTPDPVAGAAPGAAPAQPGMGAPNWSNAVDEAGGAPFPLAPQGGVTPTPTPTEAAPEEDYLSQIAGMDLSGAYGPKAGAPGGNLSGGRGPTIDQITATLLKQRKQGAPMPFGLFPQG